MRPGSEIPPAAGTWAMAEECEGCCSVWYGCVYREGDGGAKVRVYGNRFAVASLKFVVVDDAYASWREWTGFQRVACLACDSFALPHPNQEDFVFLPLLMKNLTPLSRVTKST